MYLTTTTGFAYKGIPEPHEATPNSIPVHRPIPILSTRETEVLRGIGLGFSIRELADELCLSSHTIVSHRKSLKEKFRCKKATQLAVMAERMGLLVGLSFHK